MPKKEPPRGGGAAFRGGGGGSTVNRRVDRRPVRPSHSGSETRRVGLLQRR